MGRPVSWFILLGLVACVERGRDLELSQPSALYWFVQVEASRVEVSPALRGETPSAIAIDEGTELFVVRLELEALIAAAPDVDLDAVEAVTLAAGTAVDETCEAGELERPLGAAPVLRLSANAVATLHRVLGSSPSEPIDDWPDILRGLSLSAPLHEPCARMAGRVAPFSDRTRLFEFGDVIAGRAITSENVGTTDARGVAYLDDDHVLLALPEVLLVLRRGQGHTDARRRVLADPDFLQTPGEEQFWSVHNMALDAATSPRRRASAILRLNQQLSDTESYYAGLAIADFVVTPTSISAARLRYFQPIARGATDPPKLDHVAVDGSGHFIAVGDKLVVWSGPNDEVEVAEPAAINGGSALFGAPPLPPVIIQDKQGGWWTGELGEGLELNRESRSAELMLTGETDGTMRRISRGSDTLVLSGNQLGELWERRSANNWQTHRWWLPPVASGCAAGRARCGRLEPRGFTPMSDFEVDGESVVHTFRDCDFLFRTPPGQNRCSEYLELSFDDHRLPNSNRAVNFVTRRGSHFLVAGDGGLLVELILD